MSDFSRGSEWRRWDLHVHTPASFQHQYAFADDAEKAQFQDNIWDKFIASLEGVQGVCAVGIADYFTIDGYKLVLDHAGRGRLRNFDLILPNIEFRLDKITEQSKRLNIHVIFSDSTPVADIDDLLAGVKLMLSEPGAPVLQGVGCTRNGLVQVGRMYANDQQMPEAEAYKIGCKQAVVKLDTLLEQLTGTPNFKGKYLLVGVEDSPGGLSEIPYDQSGHMRTELYRKCHVIDSQNESTIRFWLGKLGQVSEEELGQRFGGLKPCVHGSDAHSFDRLCRPDNDRFCWIKADPTFEGLKQVIYEPEERVRIQSSRPSDAERKLLIDSISVTESKGYPIAPMSLPLNRNLVAIIGGRGSGKSALAESVAFCFDKHAKEPVNRKERFIPHFKLSGMDFEIELSLSDRDGNLKSERRELSKDEVPISFPLEYLGQNKIEEYATDDAKIHGLISDSVLSASSHSSAYSKNRATIKEVEVRLVDSINQIRTLVAELSLTDVDALSNEKAKREEEKRLLSSKETQDAIAELDKARGLHTQAQSLIQELEQTISRVEAFGHTLTDGIEGIWEKAKAIGLEDIERPSIALEGLLIPLRSMMAHKRLAEIDEAYQEASAIANDRLQGQEDVSVEHIAFLSEEIDRLSKDIGDHNDKKSELQRLRAERNKTYRSLAKAYRDLQAAYQSAIDEFVARDSVKGLLKDVTFTANLEFEVDGLYQRLYGFVDGRKCRSLRNLRERIKVATIDDYCAWLEKSADSEYELDVFLESTRSALIDFLFQSHLRLTTSVKLRVDGKETALENLSLGHKGTVILKLFLATANCPIIFDQPEDHLDNNFIFSTLVPTFIEAKRKRQIIVVTHNANLVVNGDAEQVVVARFQDSRITYQSGSIENPEIRSQITDILEGGKEAFEKREHKYGFSA